VREATFNALHSLGALDGAAVLDLFAGSGALGIEALSRGATHCTFVDHARDAVATIKANLSATGLADRAEVVRADVLGYLGRAPAVVDLCLLDPPYALDDGGWAELLEALDAEVVVAESDRAIDLGPGFDAVRSRRYGGTVVVLGRRPRRRSGP
jgi:16S rRNA (guanine966-N2)-methyltransferase